MGGGSEVEMGAPPSIFSVLMRACPPMLYVRDPNQTPVPTGFLNLRTTNLPDPGGPRGSQLQKHLGKE